MANTVIALKKSGTPSAIPVDLANGELAINYADGKIFYKSAAGSIQEISGGGGNAFGTVNANGTLIVSDTTGDVFSLVPGDNITIVGDSINDKITIGLSSDVTFPGVLYVKPVGGDEGGQIELGNAVTNSTLAGNVVIDIYQNKLRFYEKDSPNKGAFIDLGIAGSGVSSNLLAGGTGSGADTVARETANAAYDKANSANLTATSSYDQSNTNSTIITASFGKANDAYTIAIASFDKVNAVAIAANSYADTVGAGANAWVSANFTTLAAGIAAYDYANTVGIIAVSAYDKANTANVLAYDTGVGANAFTSATVAGANAAVGAGANSYADTVGTSANAFASATIAGANTAVGAGANAYADIVGSSANAYLLTVIAGANTDVGTGANSYADVVGSSANSYLLSVIAGANAAVGAGANTVGSAAFDKANTAETIAIAAYTNSNTKLSASGGTITGDLSVVGNLSISGNTSYISVQNYRVDDPLIYLAGNNYTSDIVDIGFIANYVNSTGSNVHTGLYREHTDKEYYLFQGYDEEPTNNHIDPNGNNFTLAILNADIRTSNLILGGQNTIIWLNSAYDKANAANVLAYNTGIGANAFASATIAGANTAVGAGANAYSSTVGTSANAFASATIAGANVITFAAFAKANLANDIAVAAFEKANTGSGGGGANALFQRFVANGSQTAFLLSNNVSQQNNTIVSVDGLLQIPDLHYTISGSVLTFSTEPLNKSNIDVRVFSTTSTTIGTTGNNITVYLEDIYNHANIVGFAANTYSAGVGVAANSYASGVIGIAANSYASGVGANANTFASSVGLAANSYARAVGTAGNTYAASVGSSVNSYVSSVSSIASAAFNKANSTLYTSNVVISVFDNTNAALRITHTGNSAALLVEDSANPDSTPFIIDANGSVGIGNTTPSSKLTVAGVIQSTTGGVKFPDGSTQASAGASTGKAIAMAIVFGG